MGTPLKNPPVYLTLAQVRFNPILKLVDFLPSIQESFRHAGYPDFEHQHLISIQVAMQDGQRVARFAENGERVVLDDAEHEAEVERLSKYVARNCK